MPKIALVDDDRNILTSVSLTLEAEGYNVSTYTDGASGLEGLTSDKPDLAILDAQVAQLAGGEPVTLTVTEFLILQALATRPGHVKTRDQLMDAAYDDQVYVDDRTIDSHIKRLRKKFKAVDDEFEMIETLYGVGYRFKEQ